MKPNMWADTSKCLEQAVSVYTPPPLTDGHQGHDHACHRVSLLMITRHVGGNCIKLKKGGNCWLGVFLFLQRAFPPGDQRRRPERRPSAARGEFIWREGGGQCTWHYAVFTFIGQSCRCAVGSLVELVSPHLNKAGCVCVCVSVCVCVWGGGSTVTLSIGSTGRNFFILRVSLWSRERCWRSRSSLKSGELLQDTHTHTHTHTALFKWELMCFCV